MTYSTLEACPAPARFPVTTFTQRLPPGSEVTPPLKDFVRFLSVQSEMSWGRLVHLSSGWPGGTEAAGLPFDVIIKWTGGGGSGQQIRVTASGGGVVFPVHAKSLTISAANWIPDKLQVHCSIENSRSLATMDLRRALIEENLALGGGSQTFEIPRYAQDLRVSSNDEAQSSNILIDFLDYSLASISQYSADGGTCPVGAATKVMITNNDAAMLQKYTLNWGLAYK